MVLSGLQEDGEDDLLTELLHPEQSEEQAVADEEMQEADFWNGVGEEDFVDEVAVQIAATAGPDQEEAEAGAGGVKRQAAVSSNPGCVHLRFQDCHENVF